MLFKSFRISKSGACSNCRRSHRKCDRGQPCGRCVSKGVAASCSYETFKPTTISSVPYRKKHKGKTDATKSLPSSQTTQNDKNKRKEKSTYPVYRIETEHTETVASVQPQSPNLNLNTFVQETLWEDALPSPPDCSLCQETSQFPLLQIQDSQPIFCLPPGDHENEDSIHNTGDITDLSPLSFSQTFPTLFDQQVPQDDHSHFSRLSSSPMMAGERRQEGELFDVCTNEWAASEKIEAASDLMKRIGLSAYNDVFGKRVGAILLSKATMPIIFMCTPATANLWGYSHRDMLSIPWQKIMLKYNSMNVSTLRERVVAENKSKWRRSVMHLPPLRFLAVSKSGSVFEVSRRASLYFKVTDYDAELLYVHLTIYA